MSNVSKAFALLLAAGAGCESRSREPEASTSAVTPSATSIFRGTVSLAGEHWKFRPCEGEDMPAVDSSGGVLQRVTAGEAAAGSTGAYVEVRGHLAADSSLIVTEVEAAFPGEGGGCQRVAPAVEALARGNEPFETPYGPPKLGADRRTYLIRTEAHSIELVLDHTGCSDNMSGAYSAWRAVATVDGKAYAGCARVSPDAP